MAPGKPSRKKPAEKKPPLTHFLCLPLVTAASKPQLEASLKVFRDDVSPKGEGANETVSSTNDYIHPKAVRPVGALHCTLGVMSLSKDHLEQAIETLRAVDIDQLLSTSVGPHKEATEESADPTGEQDGPASLTRSVSPPSKQRSARPLQVDLRGLVSMHAPEKTSILYTAPEDSSDRLYAFCVALQDIFKRKEMLVPDDRKLKLHATIVNTIYAKGRRKRPSPRKQSRDTSEPSRTQPKLRDDAVEGNAGADQSEQDDRSQGHGPNANTPLKIDARGILEKYGDFAWAGDVVLDRVAICEMGAKKKFDDGGRLVGEEYTEVASVKLPT